MILVIHPRQHGEARDYAWLEPEIGDEGVGMCVGSGETPAEAEADAKKNLGVIIEKGAGYYHEC